MRTHRRLSSLFIPVTLFALTLTLLITPVSVSAATYTVTSSANDGTGSLREAITAANASAENDVINIAVDEISLTAALPPIANNGTLLINGDDVSIRRVVEGPAFRIFSINSGANVTLNDITITGGDAGADLGGGVYNAGTVTINGGSIADNVASWGAGIYNAGGSVTLNGTAITTNISTTGGGGLLNNGGTTTVINTSFSDNESPFGGGVYNFSGTLNLTDSSFTNNVATNGGGVINNGGILTMNGGGFDLNSAQSGGAIFTTGGTANLTNVQFLNNSAENGGAGIFIDGSTVTFVSSLVSGNTITDAGNGGGLYVGGDAAVTITGSTITNNTASMNGGGILNGGDNALTLTNTDVIGNDAPFGGGIFNGGTLEINGGSVSGNSSLFDGSGINNFGGTLTIDGSTITGNTNNGFGDGAGIHNSGSLTIIDASLTLNTTLGGSGGGIANNGGSVDLTNVSLIDNLAESGGGIANISGTVTIHEMLASLNEATIDGGAIDNAGTLELRFAIISENEANRGGGLRNQSGATANILNSTFEENAAQTYGGGIHNGGALIVTGSTLDTNDAVIEGGGLYSQSATTVINSTFVGNSASSGGGLINAAGTTTVVNSTFSGNSALSLGGGVYNSGGTLNLRNSIVANSVGSPDCDTIFATTNVQFSLIESGYAFCASGTDTGNKMGDPNLGALTGSPAYFPLNVGSSAIDAGSNDLIPSGVFIDQPGNYRIINGAVDMGSVESGSSVPPEVSIEPASVIITEGSSSDFTLTRTGTTGSDLIVTLQITPANGEMTTGDYTLSGGSITGQTGTVTVTFLSGMTSINLNITATDDDAAESDNALTIEVVNTADYTVSLTRGSSTVLIPANDLTVTTLADSGDGSLRQAVINANDFPSDDTITFAVSGSVNLTGGQLTVDDNGMLTIDGGAVTVTRDTDDEFRIFEIGENANVTLNDLTLANGRVSGDGGAIYNGGTLTLNGSTVSGSTSLEGSGGGIYNAGTLTLINSTVAGNTAESVEGLGGGIFTAESAAFTMINSTMSANAASDAGGLYIADGVGVTNLYNAILANNTPGGDCVRAGGSTVNVQNSLITVGLDACVNGVNANNIEDNPNLGALTGSPAYFPIYPGSPAINAGDNALVPVGLTSDQAGGARIYDDVVDMGAYEYDGTIPTSSLTVNMTLPGRPPAPNDAYVVSVQVQVRPTGSTTPIFSETVMTDTSGQFTISGVTPPGTYDLYLKASGTLARIYPVTLLPGENTLTIPSDQALPAGDANGDNVVNLTDFSLLASAFGSEIGSPNYNANADFNNDGFVSLIDFSLLASSYGTTGAP